MVTSLYGYKVYIYVYKNPPTPQKKSFWESSPLAFTSEG